ALDANGYLRSNSALALWLHLLGGPLGLIGAARLFLAFLLAATAATLAWLGWTLRGPAAMASIALLGWPLVHHFFVSMGLLNFWLGLAGALAALALAYRLSRSGSVHDASTGRRRGAQVALVAVAIVAWYAHPFPIALAAGLVVLEALRGEPARRWPLVSTRAVAPFLPALFLSVVTAAVHFLKPAERPVLRGNPLHFDPPWDSLLYLWKRGPVAFSWLEATTLLPVPV